MASLLKNLVTRRSAATALVAVAALAVTTAFAVAGSTSRPGRPHAPAPRHHVLSRVASSVSPAVAADFPILARPATASDAFPSSAKGTLAPEEQVGGNVALARLAANSASEGGTYLIPGATQVCVKNSAGAQNFCATVQEVEAGDAQEIITCSPAVPSSDIQVSGLLPSAASGTRITLSDGTTVPVTLDNGTYATRFARSGSLPTSISWSIGGTPHAAAISVPSGAGGEDCQPTP